MVKNERSISVNKRDKAHHMWCTVWHIEREHKNMMEGFRTGLSESQC